jgi:hypothetical protein
MSSLTIEIQLAVRSSPAGTNFHAAAKMLPLSRLGFLLRQSQRAR